MPQGKRAQEGFLFMAQWPKESTLLCSYPETAPLSHCGPGTELTGEEVGGSESHWQRGVCPFPGPASHQQTGSSRGANRGRREGLGQGRAALRPC